MNRKNIEIKILFVITLVMLISFLVVPLFVLLGKSIGFYENNIFEYYINVLTSNNFLISIRNSVAVSISCSIITTLLAFLLAYTIYYTNVPKIVKKIIQIGAVVPMLLPTITYGFAIIYAFGKQGLITKILGKQIFDIYGFNGLLLGYIIYTLPVSFLLIKNTMAYVDKRFIVVSSLMGDSPFHTFCMTIIRPLLGTLAVSFVQTFFMAFTDFGIPASVGGEFEVVATTLYYEMLGSIPNFNNGAVIAVIMLIPSLLSVWLLRYLEKFNIQYDKISNIVHRKNNARDIIFGGISFIILLAISVVLVVIVIVPFVNGWPYDMSFTTKNVVAILRDDALLTVFKNTILVALLTGIFGTIITYAASLVTAKERLPKSCERMIEISALITNTVPGMVLGIGFLFVFSGTPLQNTFPLIIACNIIHFFSTPYVMFKSSLQKINPSLEIASRLMGDSWVSTIIRVITPNIKTTFLEVFSYYFINGMVTVSAIIFITGAKTMVVTAKIKELQHFSKFNEIFILSICLFLCNLFVKGLTLYFTNSTKKKTVESRTVSIKNHRYYKYGKVVLSIFIGISIIFLGIQLFSKEGNGNPVIIYSNADDEAIKVMEQTLDDNGYQGKYIIQSFGTSELGGKLLAEGTNIEADVVTMSSFYLESGQEKYNMFLDLDFKKNTIIETPSFYAPITSQEGTIIINTKELEENNLPMPTSLKDLANPIYKHMISIPDIKGSSTGWLLIQGLISEYGEEEAAEILTQIYENVGPHLESSGSGPIKKIRAGEVAIGFGLRHQAISDMEEGLPIELVDPVEGNFALTESVAVVNKENKNSLAMEIAKCIVEKGRSGIKEYYPNPIYEGETADSKYSSAYPKVFSENLTASLLEKHQQFSEKCKKN